MQPPLIVQGLVSLTKNAPLMSSQISTWYRTLPRVWPSKGIKRLKIIVNGGSVFAATTGTGTLTPHGP